MNNHHFVRCLFFVIGLMFGAQLMRGQSWDVASDTWVATDALGRAVVTAGQTVSPRADRYVGIFYFLWLGPHANGGPYDVSQILARDPQAMQKGTSPPWGPLHVPHHWGQSWFGYYLSDDAGVLRKHAQMLADAGVDTLVFDVTNGFTYRSNYMALLKVFSEMRKAGNKTPCVAFLCPFGNPMRVVNELWHDLYEPGLYSDLWFQWHGKPLILADPAFIGQSTEGNTKWNTPVALQAGQTLGQSFSVTQSVLSVSACFPTWNTTEGAVTLRLRKQGPEGAIVSVKRFTNINDNEWLILNLAQPEPAGNYYLEASEVTGKVGWWSHTDDLYSKGQAFANGTPQKGDRSFRVGLSGSREEKIRRFFTFRKPQPDYFAGPAKPDMWSWLEVYPQHVFKNAQGEKEMMSVGVAQNAVTNRLGSMSELQARGRSYHNGKQDPSPGAVNYGFNVAEQWDHALKEDPGFVFLTGWNEWIAGRYNEFGGVRFPVIFVDQFDQEHSRDIEPMQGGHEDAYYYQMVSYIRRYKGSRKPAEAKPGSIVIDGQFEDWKQVEPEFRDQIGDPVERDHSGYATAPRYINHSGRNDIVAAKCSWDANNVFFYVRTRAPLTPHGDANWMLLFLNTDNNRTNGWLGYDYVVNRVNPTDSTAFLEKHAGAGYGWTNAERIEYRVRGNEMELAIPRRFLGMKGVENVLEFKWADNIRQNGQASDFTLNGDAAPNDRFNYRVQWREASP